jgi:hypothetical protein
MKSIEPNQAIEQALRDALQVDLSWIEPPPTADGWTLAPDALRFVTKIVEVLRPRHVLELGSGLSTRLLSRAAGALSPKCVISSVDHDPQFNWGSGGATEENGGAKVKFHLAPLVVREFGGKLLGAYLIQPEKLATKRPADLVVIDGPPVNLGGREGTLYQVMDFARPGTVVLLDDSKRPEERAAIKAWEENLGDAVAIRQLPGFAKGMASIVINRPVATKDFWRQRFELSKAEIERVVPEGQSVLIAGDNWWGDELDLARPVLPFTEKDGKYWGEPADDAAAIAELDRLVAGGARFIAFGWPTFWWLAHYKGLTAELSHRGHKLLDNDRLVLFDLRKHE